jgi:hypothetical protein
VLLLTTGRNSNAKRTTPLIYHADDYLVVASNGGDPPGWLVNLQGRIDHQVAGLLGVVCLAVRRPRVLADVGVGVPTMILPKVRDPRFVTIRRGGTLTDSDHQLLALWAASCAEHVLGLFESARPEDPRPRQAIEHARAWVRGEVTMTQARTAAGRAMAAARDLRGAARHAAYAAGQAGVVAHVAAHELGAAAYAIKAARAGAPEGEGDGAGRLECRWQRDQLPEAIRELVLDDQRLRNDICWSVFDC